jgi:cysteine synthase
MINFQAAGDVKGLLVGVVAGATLVALGWLCYGKINKRAKSIKKVSLVDCVGNTPLIYLPRISEACGAEIYVR